MILAAHYDSVAGTVGANDNGTGVAAVLEIARLMRQMRLKRIVRFVLFVNEEPPYFQTASMGSRVYAHQLRQDSVPVSAMLSLETIGFYSDDPGSQDYPPVLSLFYPSKGTFIAFVGNTDSRGLVRESVRDFRESTRFPSEGIAAPGELARNWMVGSVVVLAGGISRHHCDGYGFVSLPRLPHAERYRGQGEFR